MKHAYASRRRRRGGYGTRQDRQRIYGGAGLGGVLGLVLVVAVVSSWLAPYNLIKRLGSKKSAMQSKGESRLYLETAEMITL